MPKWNRLTCLVWCWCLVWCGV